MITTSFSAVGDHETNEDAFAVSRHPEVGECVLCAVADGQGGRAGGEKAARTACDSFIVEAGRRSPRELKKARLWGGMLRGVDEAVFAENDAGFSTLVAFALTNEWVCGASSGDSAALLVNAGRRAQVLTESQIKNPPVGSGSARFVPFASRLVAPWSVVTMTDGVWKYAGWPQVMQLADQLRGQELIDALRSRAALPGGVRFQDDFTLVVLEND